MRNDGREFVDDPLGGSGTSAGGARLLKSTKHEALRPWRLGRGRTRAREGTEGGGLSEEAGEEEEARRRRRRAGEEESRWVKPTSTTTPIFPPSVHPLTIHPTRRPQSSNTI
eukprot:3318405-Pyramimonas_sp.AAC.1